MDYKQELEKIEKQVNSNKEEKIKLNERLKHLKEAKDKIVVELKDEGITEKELQDKVNELEIEIGEKITECQEVLK